MSMREKQKAKKRAEEEANELFTEKTGIKDESKGLTLDNMMARF